MKIARHNIFLFLTVLSAITGSYFFYDWRLEKVNLLLCLSNFIPSAIFFIIYRLEKKYDSKKRIQSASHAIILFTLIPCILFLYFTNSFIPVEYGIKNPRKYSSILANKWGNDLVHHFPKKIPEDAKNVKFFYKMGYMQGGSAMQLRYSASPVKIAELYERFSKKKTRSFQGGNSNDHMNQENGMPTTFFYTGDKYQADTNCITGETTNSKFPEDYEIMIFDWIPSNKEKKRRGLERSFNHGKSHGVAISKKRNTIVYWAESW